MLSFLFSRITYFIHFIYLFFFKLDCQPHRKVTKIRHGQWPLWTKRVHKVFFIVVEDKQNLLLQLFSTLKPELQWSYKNCHENTYSCNVYDFWAKRMSHFILISCNFWKHLEEVHIMVTLFWCGIVQLSFRRFVEFHDFFFPNMV